MNRREFLKLLGIGTTTIVTIGTGLWTPPNDFVLGRGVLNTFDIGTGNREDLLDIITNIAPMDTLYLSQFEKVPPDNILHQWLVDELR